LIVSNNPPSSLGLAIGTFLLKSPCSLKLRVVYRARVRLGRAPL